MRQDRWLQRPKSVRAIFLWTMTIFGLLATGAALTLAAFNLRFDALSEEVAAEAFQVRAVSEIRLNVLLLNRSFLLLRVTGDETYRREGRQALREAWGWMRAAKSRALDEDDQAWLKELEERIDAFVQRLGVILQPGPEAEEQRDQLIVEMSAILTLATDYLDKVEAEQIEHQQVLAKLNALLTKLSVIASFVLPLAFLLVVLQVRRRIFLPFTGLQESLGTYAAGEKDSRAPLGGPTELRDMAQSFNTLADQLRKERESRYEFLLGVAHDLQNPLTALKGQLTLAERAKGRAKIEEVERRFEKVTILVKRLDRLVSDLVDMTRLDAGHFDLRFAPCDLRELVREVGSIYENASPLHPIQLELPDEVVTAFCDESRMSQVLINLLSNALKYSPNGGPITIRLYEAEEAAVIEVEDRGIGIEEAELSTIFQTFHRIQPKRVPGIGLGLSVAKGLVEAQGGRIEVESRPGEGSTFRVRIPLSR